MAKQKALEMFQRTVREFGFTVLNEEEDTAIDATAFTLSWMVKKRKSDPDADAAVTITTFTIEGVFNPDRSVNTQVVVVTVEDTHTANVPAGIYHHELKRTNPGFPVVLSYGQFTLRHAVHQS